MLLIKVTVKTTLVATKQFTVTEDGWDTQGLKGVFPKPHSGEGQTQSRKTAVALFHHLSQSWKQNLYFLSSLFCFTGGYPDWGPHPKEATVILLLASVVSGSSHARSIFGKTWRVMLSNLVQKPDLVLLTIVTDLCICTEYAKHKKCLTYLPNN